MSPDATQYLQCHLPSPYQPPLLAVTKTNRRPRKADPLLANRRDGAIATWPQCAATASISASILLKLPVSVV